MTNSLAIRFFEGEFAVCQLRDPGQIDWSRELLFLAKTPDEFSLVCPADAVPENAAKVEHGWSMFRIEGQLDFALVGILARITGLLAEAEISVFAVSTFDTDYILVKTASLPAAREIFRENGYVL